MARSSRIVGFPIALFGLLLMVFPFISVSRLGTDMLAELPKLDGAEIVDHQVGWRAMFSDDFVVARRTYPGVSKQTVLAAYRGGPFESHGIDSFTRECCGDYDAVFVSITVLESGAIQAQLRPADADFQASWPVVAVLGFIVATAGLAAAGIGHRHSRRDRDGGSPAERDPASSTYGSPYVELSP